MCVSPVNKKNYECEKSHEGCKADLTLTDLTPSLATEVSKLPLACMACMCVPPQMTGGNPQVGIKSLITFGEDLRVILWRESSPPPTHCTNSRGTESTP